MCPAWKLPGTPGVDIGHGYSIVPGPGDDIRVVRCPGLARVEFEHRIQSKVRVNDVQLHSTQAAEIMADAAGIYGFERTHREKRPTRDDSHKRRRHKKGRH